MFQEIRVRYSRAGSGAIQFGGDVTVSSAQEFKDKVLDVIDTQVGRDDVFDLTLMTQLGEILFFESHGVPSEILAIVAAALRGTK